MTAMVLDRPATIGLDEAAAEAVRRAIDANTAGLLLWTIPLDAPPDPVAFFASAGKGESRTFWQQPERGIALVGIGEAAVLAGAGDRRFRQVGASFSTNVNGSVAAAAPGASAHGPLALGGFAFDPKRSGGDEWKAFPDGLMVVPKALLRLAPDGAALTVAVPVTPEADVAATAAAAREAAARSSRSAEFAPVCIEPPQPLLRRDVPPPAEWKREVARAAADVRAGRLDKVVLARTERVLVAGEIDVAATLLRMRAANPSASLFAVARNGSVFLGASPETLIRLRDGAFETTPLAGSIARGSTPDEDSLLARRLLRSAKDRHEHEVVVGAILQVLDPVSAEVAADPAAPRVVAHRTVQHLATPIHGRARSGMTVLDLVDRLHPTPAVGGYPTDAALAAIRTSEGFDRGWYAGPIGWIGSNGDGEFAIGIRSALVAGNQAVLYAGCGIVGDSDPESEYAETLPKLRAIGAALGAE
jgi:isochorismate synthase